MNRTVRTLLIVGILAVAFFAIWQSGLIATISDFDAFSAMIERAGFWGYFIYILIFTAAAVFSLPAFVITITGGVVFGPIIGGLLALAGATFGSAAAFLVARYLARGFIVDKFGGNAIFKKIEAGVAKNGKDFLILTRLVPVFPYNIQNYAYGVTNINFGQYIIITAITMAPGAFIYAYMAGEIAVNGVSTTLFVQLIIAGVILFGVSQIPKILAKKKGIDMSNI